MSPTIDAVWPGQPYPRGATWDGMGVNFALFSEHGRARRAVPVRRQRPARAAARRAARADRPGLARLPAGGAAGPALRLPRARAVPAARRPPLQPAQAAARPLRAQHRRRAALARRAVRLPHRPRRARPVLRPPRQRALHAALQGASTPRSAGATTGRRDVPWHETVIYELHVRGFTMRHPERAASAARHLCRPGLRAGHRAPEAPGRHHRRADAGARLRRRPPPGRSAACATTGATTRSASSRPSRATARRARCGEFKTMVRTLHAAGIEVHPRRGLQPHRRGQRARPDAVVPRHRQRRLLPARARRAALLRGLHRLRQHAQPAAPARAAAGDGLAALLGRGDARRRLPLRPGLGAGARAARGRQARRASSTCCARTRCCRASSSIAEPWDLGSGGYQVGNFPVGWAEWNDRYRDTMRAYWKGEGGLIGEFAQPPDRLVRPVRPQRPQALRQHQLRHRARRLHAGRPGQLQRSKHNEANGEDNRDGHDHNLSWNCGVEGPTDDAPCCALRARQKRNLLATLLLSQGVPMLLAGDELGRTQQGNNNAYCQDNETSWLDWSARRCEARAARVQLPADRAARARTRPSSRRDFFQGRPLYGSQVHDIVWLQPDGSEMTEASVAHEPCARAGRVPGRRGPERDRRPRPAPDRRRLPAAVQCRSRGDRFRAAATLAARSGEVLVDTACGRRCAGGRRFAAGTERYHAERARARAAALRPAGARA